MAKMNRRRKAQERKEKERIARLKTAEGIGGQKPIAELQAEAKPIPTINIQEEQTRTVQRRPANKKSSNPYASISTFQAVPKPIPATSSQDDPLVIAPQGPMPDTSQGIPVQSGDIGRVTAAIGEWNPNIEFPLHLTADQIVAIQKRRSLTTGEYVMAQIHLFMRSPDTQKAGIELFMKAAAHNRQVEANKKRMESINPRVYGAARVSENCLPPLHDPGLTVGAAASVTVNVNQGADKSEQLPPVIDDEPGDIFGGYEWIVRMPHNRRGPRVT